MASYSVHFIIFIQVTMLVDVSTCFDNRTRCQLCGDGDNNNNNTNNNITICSDFNLKNKTKMQCNNHNTNNSNNFKYVFNQSTDNNSTKLYLEFVESFPTIDLTLFPNVTILKIKTENKIIDFDKLKNPNNITVLNLTSNAIITVTNLTTFQNLRLLDLSHNLIENMSSIVLPPKVEVLNLSSNNISIDNNIILPESLKSLNLSNNDIKSTNNVSVTGLLQKLDLRGNKITSVKSFTNLATLEELYLSNNNISSLGDGVFATLSSLIRLDLSANKLSTLGERCFAGLNRLQHLDVSENVVFSMEPGTFQYMTNLIWLKLSGNVNLGEPEKPNKDVSLLLGTGQRLQTIEASRTNLTNIPSTLTRSVRTLHLSENKISYLQCGDLDSYPLLKILNLTENKIKDIEDDALGRLEFLNYLLLSGNLLKTIPRSLPDNLIVLDLNRNKIEALTSNDFVGLSKLQTLLLRNNVIQAVNDGTFAQLSSLEILDLSENPVRILSSNTFIGPRKLKQLILTSLRTLTPSKEPLSFPVPETEHLQLLNLSSSPILVNQLLDDYAALTMFRQLIVLDISYGNITNVRLDLERYLPRLKLLVLSGNKFNCTDRILTLAKWLGKLQNNSRNSEEDDDEECYQYLSDRETSVSAQSAKENQFRIRYCEHCFSEPYCYFPNNLRGRSISSLNEEDFFKATTTSTTPTTARTTTTKLPTTMWTPPTMRPTTMVTPSKATMAVTTTMTKTTVLSPTTIHSTNILNQQNNTLNTNKTPTQTTVIYETLALKNRSHVDSLINFILPMAIRKISNRTTGGTDRQNDAIMLNSSNNNNISSTATQPLINYFKTALSGNITRNQHKDVQLKHNFDDAASSNTTSTGDLYYNVSANNVSADNTANETAITTDNDDYIKPYENITGEIKNDAYKEDIKKTKVSSTSHPGMFVFLSVLTMILMASVIMMSSQWRQYRYRLEFTRGYMPQQDIEVRSLSSVGGYDLW